MVLRNNLLLMGSRALFDLDWNGFHLELGRKTQVMGILNLTPDSFSGDGLYGTKTKARRRALKIARRMVEDGADIIDVGGESTRPGAKRVSLKEEIERVIPVIEKLAKIINVPISVDTSKGEVARKALDAGASIINDTSGLKNDGKLAEVAARYKVPVVIMHIKGTPRTMQKRPCYKSVISELIASLKKSIEYAVRKGIEKNRIIIDPGIGFGKTNEHNLEILNRLGEFKTLERPLLIGTSRKSLIGNVLGLPVGERLMGTAATVALAIKGGVHIVRVHDVKEMSQAARMTDAILGS